ncbi:MAG: MucBP domain-containing protein [Bacilli bacterium]
MKKSLKKFTKILVLIAMIFSDLMTPIKVFANEMSDTDPVKGDIGINNKVTNDGNSITVSSGSLDDEGDVLVTKTVSKTNTEGKYEVRFKIEGKDVTTTTTSTKPIYAVVVFDRSGSMYEEKCDFLFFRCKEVKYSSAVNGARTFAKTLLNKFSNANLSLVAFSTDVKVLTNPKGDGFVNGNFDSINFGNPDGVTNLTGALNKAKELLDAKTGDYTKYVVVISDGEPTNANGYVTTEAINQAIAAASEIKNSNIEIFSIGYETDRAASNVLKNISSGEGYYVNADPDTVAAKFSEITSNITSSTFAGTEAKLTDKIGSDFTVIPNDNITIDEDGNVSAEIGNITEGGTEVSFYVQIDGDNADGWANVNEGFNLSYKNAQNEYDSLNYSQNNEQPQVYWEKNEYKYSVNYFFNDQYGFTTEKTANYGDKISASSKYLSEKQLEDNNKKGYFLNSENPSNPSELIIGTNESSNVINIYYVSNGKVTAKYVDENNKEIAPSEITTDVVGKNYNTTAKEVFGYTLKEEPENKTGKYTEEDIIVTYIYTKNIGTSEEELDKEGLEVVGSINDAFDYTITYNTTIKDYVGKATLVITDILPYEIDEEKSTISNNCKYEDGVITCTYTKDNSSVFAVRSIILDEEESRDIVFNIEENFKLYYINITDKEVTNKVTAELTYGETTKTTDDEYTTEVEESKVIVNYVTKDGTKLTDSITLTGLVGTTYETVKKEFDKYSFIEVIGEVEGSFTKEDKEVTYVYDLTILPPQTGIETNMFMYINYIFALLGIAVAIKTYKTIKNN